jgi:hypothetical protein
MGHLLVLGAVLAAWSHEMNEWKTMKMKNSTRRETGIVRTTSPKPISSLLRITWGSSLLLLTLVLPATMPAQISPPSIGGFGMDIGNDLDVSWDASTDSGLVFAYDWNNVSGVVNGVTFTAPGSGVTLSGFSHRSGGFVVPDGPAGSLSPAYQSVLDGAIYGDTGAVCTVTLNNLSAGCWYEVEFWVNDSTAAGFDRTETFTFTADGSFSGGVILNHGDVVGGCGDHCGFVFVAVAPTQDITVSGNVVAQINAMELRTWAPRFTNFGLSSGGSLPLTFFGVVGQSYSLLTASSLSLSKTNWTTLTSGTFGTTPVTYRVTGLADGPHFFIIKSP